MDYKIILLIIIFLFCLSINTKPVSAGTDICLLTSDTYNCSFCKEATAIENCEPHDLDCADTKCANWINGDVCNWTLGVNFCNYTFTVDELSTLAFCAQVMNFDEYFCYYHPPLNTIDFSQLNYIRQFGNVLHNHNICSDNQTLSHNITYTINIDQNQSIVNVWVDEPCEYGCDNSTMTCNPSPIQGYGIYILVIITFLIMVGILFKMYGGR